MKFFQQLLIFILTVVLSLCLVACSKEKKQGKVIITEQEFVLRQDRETNFTIDAKGKIKNIGEVDVKKVVVTGYCRSCNPQWIIGQWVITPEIEKMPNQKDIISYLAVGSEESFSFEEITDMRLRSDQKAPEMPEKLEIVIESFETVGK
ncbi:MAG: hypothetical protein J7K96_05900 [Desulfobacteraceae bacterium]|nr:hypothetical protein [Desulfobacteraceae bacterium]